MTKSFEIIEHTADIGIRAFGKTRKEVYENAAHGLFSLIVAPKTVRKSESTEISLTGNDPVDLLVTWLHEILFRFDALGYVYADVTVSDVCDTGITATLHGEPIIFDRHEVIAGIKAVTYHAARVEREGDGWVAEVLFDV